MKRLIVPITTCLVAIGALLLIVGPAQPTDPGPRSVPAVAAVPLRPRTTHSERTQTRTVPVTTSTSTTTTAPAVVCSLQAPGVNNGEVIDGRDFDSWRDMVSEDGRLDYGSHIWALALWHGGTEVVGYSLEEDSDIWNTMSCAEDHPAYHS